MCDYVEEMTGCGDSKVIRNSCALPEQLCSSGIIVPSEQLHLSNIERLVERSCSSCWYTSEDTSWATTTWRCTWYFISWCFKWFLGISSSKAPRFVEWIEAGEECGTHANPCRWKSRQRPFRDRNIPHSTTERTKTGKKREKSLKRHFKIRFIFWCWIRCIFRFPIIINFLGFKIIFVFTEFFNNLGTVALFFEVDLHTLGSEILKPIL